MMLCQCSSDMVHEVLHARQKVSARVTWFHFDLTGIPPRLECSADLLGRGTDFLEGLSEVHQFNSEVSSITDIIVQSWQERHKL
jgi:hypothetical protein